MNLSNIHAEIPPIRVLIVDAMAILQGMKKVPGMKMIAHLKKAFLNKILRLSKGYDEVRIYSVGSDFSVIKIIEVRIVFDHYLKDNLKSKTRASRATSKQAEKASYDVHDNMSIVSIPLKDLFSSSSTKSSLTVLFSEAILEKTAGSDKIMKINIRQRVETLGVPKSQGLIVIHNFSGADWGGKFVGISKKTWVQTYLSLDDDDIVECFKKLGGIDLSEFQMKDLCLPQEFHGLERFFCMSYSSNNGPFTLSSLRWEMIRSKNLQEELLPPTRATLFPNILRTNYVCTQDKSYFSSKPTLPKLEENGWHLKDDKFEPVRCVAPPAPKGVLELVKCGCRKKCAGNCSCLKNKVPCTALCKCYAWGCDSCVEFRKPQEDAADSDGEDQEQE